MNIQELEQAQKRFRELQIESDGTYFDKLKEGQKPSFFVLSCCDSRTCPSTITGLPLGELFIHRNIANQVVAGDDSFTASLYYAVEVLEVDYILVLGHTYCGGVEAATKGIDKEHLNPWLKHVASSISSVKNSENAREIELTNIKSQMNALQNHQVLKEASRSVEILGSLFHLESGELEWVNL
ncbi:carbonic anhydrase [Paenalkalicoccus suaedae]|uniref:carbonic anhydrase n=1 Tax=Paenalkalicoccus suaedae TaxID=2592382 RepID=A0A859FDA0_9BACI|nr:carbonic anhydrase [Paenalkalicoccus suaedae]QKS70554.1 carbonic anhydrase [Paenalkalicoccus suaedae]